jgi:predicted phosphodiesterase
MVMALALAGAACAWPAPVRQDAAGTAAPAATIALPPILETPTAVASPVASRTPFPFDLPLADAVYKIPLTLRHVTSSSATLYVELDRPVLGRLVVVPDDPAGDVRELRLDGATGAVQWTAEGLAPASRYTAMVALDEPDGKLAQPGFRERAWGPLQFSTVDESAPMRIGVISDASFGDEATMDLIRQMADSDLDFVLHAGDVVDETEMGVDPFDSFAVNFFAPFRPLLTHLPVYTVPGNHDRDGDIEWEGKGFYFHAFPVVVDPQVPEPPPHQPYYAFVRGGVQFVMLDSQVFFGVGDREEETAWLEERLADPRFPATIAVMHVAPFSSSSVHPDNSLPVREAWAPLFARARVPLVFSGHFHQYERLVSQGVTYIVAGGGSSTLYAPGEMMPQSQSFHRRTHFVLVEIDGGTIRLTAIALGGEVLDRVEIPLVRPAP